LVVAQSQIIMGLQIKLDIFRLILWFIREQIRNAKVVVGKSVKKLLLKDRLFFVIAVKFIINQ